MQRDMAVRGSPIHVRPRGAMHTPGEQEVPLTRGMRKDVRFTLGNMARVTIARTDGWWKRNKLKMSGRQASAYRATSISFVVGRQASGVEPPPIFNVWITILLPLQPFQEGSVRT